MPNYTGTGAPAQATFATTPSATSVATLATQLTTGFWNYTGEGPGKFAVKAGGTLNVNLSALTAEGRTLALMALDSWTQATGIIFNTSPTAGATIHLAFDDNQDGAWSSSSKSAGKIFSSFVNVSTNWIASYGTGVASYSLQTYIHEIGHALGLGHAGNYNGSATYSRDATYAFDSWQLSIMSYFAQNQNPTTGASFAWVVSPQLADLKAMETLYGVNTKAGYGATTYGVGSNAGLVQRAIGEMMATGTLAQPVSFTVIDRNGTDLFDFSTDRAAQEINMLGGSQSSIYGLRGNMLIEQNTVIENLKAGLASDEIRGNAAANTIWAGTGNDTVEGGDGADTIYGEAGTDALLGGLSNDKIYGGDGTDWISGEDGNDWLEGGAEIDTLLGGIGNDTLYGGDGVDVLDGGDGNDVVYGDGGAERIAGSTGSDKLYGGADNDTLLGEVGNDSLYGGDGVDALDGGDGNDVLYGDAGAETLVGGLGEDKLYGGDDADDLVAGAGNDGLDGGNGADTLRGEAGNDMLIGGADNDLLLGDAGNDNMAGGTGDDTLTAGEGNDVVKGEDGVDLLDGGAGNDTMDGGAGDDTLSGGEGVDYLTGGLGADLFVMTPFEGSRDTVRDFVSGTDHIGLGDLHLADGAGMIAGSLFSGAAGELRYTITRSGIIVEFDANGDALTDLTFTLSGATALLASDFL